MENLMPSYVMSLMGETHHGVSRSRLRRCTRGKCGRILGTCSTAGWNYHVHLQIWARCSRETDGQVDCSCSSFHRHHRRIGYLHCGVRCSREKDGRVDHNCSSYHRRDHHRVHLGDSHGKCDPPRCSYSRLCCRRQSHHHLLQNAAEYIPWRCVPALRNCSTNGLPS